MLTDLQSHLTDPGADLVADPHTPTSALSDLVGLIGHLKSIRRFHQDGPLGRIFHPGSASFRENQAHDSLHIVVKGNRIAAHVDRVSPLNTRPERPTRHSPRQIVGHNLAGAAHDLLLLIRGRQGDHRSELHCEWLWDPADHEPRGDDLLDPRASSWSVHLDVRVAGTLDELRLQQALATALGRQPINREILDVVTCSNDADVDSARAQFQSTPVGMSDWPPVRARLARHRGGDFLMLNFNHAAADGVGAMYVLQALADAYAGSTQSGPLPDFLTVNDLPVRPTSAPVSDIRATCRSLVERLRDRLVRPARLEKDEGTDEEGYGFHLVQLTAEDTQRVVNAERPGTSRNVLLAGLHLAIGIWNREHGSHRGRVGVLVPVNLRPPDWPPEAIANVSVTARISTSPRHRAHPDAALRTITGQTTRNKRTRSGIALLAALRRSGMLPLWAKQSVVVLQPLTRNRFVDTAMLANLGALNATPSFGTLAGETIEMWMSAPARTPECLCIGVVTLDRRLHLTFRYPHRLFSPASIERFANYYVDQITQAAGRRW